MIKYVATYYGVVRGQYIPALGRHHQGVTEIRFHCDTATYIITSLENDGAPWRDRSEFHKLERVFELERVFLID